MHVWERWPRFFSRFDACVDECLDNNGLDVRSHLIELACTLFLGSLSEDVADESAEQHSDSCVELPQHSESCRRSDY